jgi:hypothetical protein
MVHNRRNESRSGAYATLSIEEAAKTGQVVNRKLIIVCSELVTQTGDDVHAHALIGKGTDEIATPHHSLLAHIELVALAHHSLPDFPHAAAAASAIRTRVVGGSGFARL